MLEKQYLLPSAEQLREELPLKKGLAALKNARDEEIKSIISEKSDKLLVVIGPCSAHDFSATIEYVERLAKINERVKDRLMLVPRLYTAKPRTRGVGYQGLFLQPEPNGEADIRLGLRLARKLHLTAIENSGLSGADELLFPENVEYLSDIVSYYAIGARSVENPLHRQTASGLSVPVGMKNPTSGNLIATVNAVYAARTSQTFRLGEYQVRSTGNPYAHVILRGGVELSGADFSNYDEKSVKKLEEIALVEGVDNLAVLIDANHSNSGKQYQEQVRIVNEVSAMRKQNPAYARLVRGVMVESFLEADHQATAQKYGQSITDPCLGWADTERLLLSLAEE